MPEDPPLDPQKIVQDLHWKGVLDEMSEDAARRMGADPEWAQPRWIHVHTIVTAFMVGISAADCWHYGYKLPPNFESVVNWIAHCVQEKWPKEEVAELSLMELRKLLDGWAVQHPDWKLWNEGPEGSPPVAVVTRYTPVPDQRDFIDLGAALHNMCLYVRDQRRHDDAWETVFDIEQFGPGHGLMYAVDEDKQNRWAIIAKLESGRTLVIPQTRSFKPHEAIKKFKDMRKKRKKDSQV